MKVRSIASSLAAVALTVTLASAQTWTELTPQVGDEPEPRYNAAAIYDPVDHRIVVFSGKTSGGDVNDVWAFDLTNLSWTELTPGAGPAPVGRYTANAIYDHVNHSMVIWSGQASSVFLNDVWAFDLTSMTWSEFTPGAPMPNIRYGTAAVFDPLTRELVTFAGFTNQGRFDDIWRFDVDADQWTEVTPQDSPVKRCLHSASYDALEHKMTMYGGQSSGALDDIWSFDLTTDTWTNLTPAVRPPGRYWAAHTYDSTRHRALIFGGTTTPGGAQDEVWEFDLTTGTWTELEPQGTGPTSRDGSSAIYVVTEDRMIAFGGNGGGFRNDVWELSFTPDGGIVFPWSIFAEGNTFNWAIPSNIQFVRGDLATVGDYAFDILASRTHATSFGDIATPTPGAGFWYLVRLDGDNASWQTDPDAETARDTALP